jgi:hypothetical protein
MNKRKVMTQLYLLFSKAKKLCLCLGLEVYS